VDQRSHGCDPSPPSTLSSRKPPGGGSQEILIGDAGVRLVMSRLASWRIPVTDAMHGQAYDLIADVHGTGLLRVQVKTKTCITRGKVRFRMQRGFYYSKRGNFDYNESDYDIAAFVYLPANTFFFWASPRRYVAIPPTWFDPVSVEHPTWLLALKHLDESRRRRAARASQGASAMPAPAPSAARPPGRSSPPRPATSPDSPSARGSERAPSSSPNEDYSVGPRRTYFSSDES
jgi:PD-(D/E)XK endonuclease